jgi:hypothetical protein
MDFEILKTVLTFVIGTACGGLGGSIFTHWVNRPRLIVNGRFVPGDKTADVLGYGGIPSEDTIRFDLTNSSPRKLNVVALGFVAKPSKDFVTFVGNAITGDNSLPHTLDESELYSVFVSRLHLPPLDTIEYLVAKDSYEKIHKSQKYPLRN